MYFLINVDHISIVAHFTRSDYEDV